MLRSCAYRLSALLVFLAAAGNTVAFVGEPNSMTVTVKQGASTLVSQCAWSVGETFHNFW